MLLIKRFYVFFKVSLTNDAVFKSINKVVYYNSVYIALKMIQNFV